MSPEPAPLHESGSSSIAASNGDTVEGALGAISSWGATHSCAAASNADGILAVHGEAEHPFEIASITKLLTAWTVLIAVEEGTLSLDGAAGPPGSTVRNLLSHTSGLDFDSRRILSPPGQRRIYSNSGYEALAAHLEDSSGLSFAEYLTEGVLQPLGMHSTRLEGSPASGLVSSMADLLVFLDEFRRPRLLSTVTTELLRTVQYPSLAGVLPGWGRQDPCDWGLGPEIRGDKSPHWSGQTAGRTTLGHFGGSGCFLWLDPPSGLGCIALGDRPFGDWSVGLWPGFSDSVRAAAG